MSETTTRSGRAQTIAAATPATRDRYVDLLRGLSILVVVLGHWLMAAVYWKGGKAGGNNTLELVPWARILTWFLQVMPLFFFVGGFANATGWESIRRRGEGYGAYLAARVRRLMAPTAIFIGIWIVLANLLVRVVGEAFEPAVSIVAKPLWFIGVYLIVVALAPAMLTLHRRHGVAVPVTLAAVVVAVDGLRLGLGVGGVGWVNFPVMWLLVHQLGFFYADGTLTRMPRKNFVAAALFGFASLAVLTGSGLYPTSMVGVPGQRMSNMDPPSVAILALSIWLIGLAMALRAPATRWLQRPRAWAAVVGVNGVIMTTFLWHLTALLIGIGVFFPLGFPQPRVGTGEWWLLRPIWLVLLGLTLAGLVRIVGRFERPKPAAGAAPASLSAAVMGMTCLVGMTGAFAIGGFTGGPAPAGIPVVQLGELGVLVAGSAVLCGRADRTATRSRVSGST